MKNSIFQFFGQLIKNAKILILSYVGLSGIPPEGALGRQSGPGYFHNCFLLLNEKSN